MSDSGKKDIEFDVLWPGGEATYSTISRPSARAEFSKMRIGFVWDYVFRGDKLFEIIERELSAKYPRMSFVRYEKFGNIHGAEERDVVASLPQKMLEYRVDAAIVGVGA